MRADAVEIRVLGSLIEKQHLTPDAYPLTLNALRLACNQSTSRDPVLDLDERAIREALERLGIKRWARLASGAGSRAPKYRHLLDDALGLDRGQLALLAVLMLRGEQTAAELRQRAERLHRFASREAAEETLGRLVESDLVALRARGPGQKEDRYAQLLGDGAAAAAAPPPPDAAAEPLAARVEQLERGLAEVRAQLTELARRVPA